MYTRRYTIIVILLVSAILFGLVFNVYSQSLKYRILREYVTLTVEKDAYVTLVYNLTVIVDEGAIKRYVAIGMPNSNFKVLEAKELDTNKEVSYEENKDSKTVTLHVSSPITSGKTRTFYLVVSVKNLIFKDKTNLGNGGFQFIPSWFPVRVEDLRLTVVLPEGVKKNEVKNMPNYDNIFTIDGRIALYWERHGLKPNEKFKIGVSFPEKYLSTTLPEPSNEEEDWSLIIFFVLFFLIFVVPFLYMGYIFLKGVKKVIYSKPELFIEALGPRKGLYAPEAAWIIESEKDKPNYSKILTMILYSLIKKNVVQIISLNPLKIEKNEEFSGRLRYYERSFLRCIEEDGSLNEDCLIKVIDVLDKGVANKMRGYSRKETIEYYKNIVSRAWNEVQNANTPLLKIQKAQENMDWLLLDPDYHSKFRIVLNDPTPIDIQYIPVWSRTLPLSSRRAYVQNPPNIVQIADNIASNMESVSESIVKNVESFSEKVARVIEGRSSGISESRSRPIYSSSCACVSCACACACVSCACACASGGAG